MKLKKTLKDLLMGTALALGSLGIFSSNDAEAQTQKPLYIINPFEHKENPDWKFYNKTEKDSILENVIFPQDSIWYENQGKGWLCFDFSGQTLIDYKGYPELDTLNLSNFNKSIQKNGKYKIPIFEIYFPAFPQGVGEVIQAGSFWDFVSIRSAFYV